MTLTNPVKALLHKDQLRWNSDQFASGSRVPTTGGNIGSGVDISFEVTDVRPSGLSEDLYRNFTAFSNVQKQRIGTAINQAIR